MSGKRGTVLLIIVPGRAEEEEEEEGATTPLSSPRPTPASIGSQVRHAARAPVRPFTWELLLLLHRYDREQRTEASGGAVIASSPGITLVVGRGRRFAKWFVPRQVCRKGILRGRAVVMWGGGWSGAAFFNKGGPGATDMRKHSENMGHESWWWFTTATVSQRSLWLSRSPKLNFWG